MSQAMPWMGIQDLWTFLLAVLVFLALPGPCLLYTSDAADE